VELFEARRPAGNCGHVEIDGTVTLGPIAKGKRKLIITATTVKSASMTFHAARTSTCRKANRVRAGEALMDGPLNPHDILRVLGMQRLQEYLVNENPGGLSPPGCEHQRQAHRGDCSADVALGEDQGSWRYGLPARRAGGSFPLH